MDIETQINLILKSENVGIRYIKISYVTEGNKVIDGTIDLLSAKPEFKHETWDVIHLESIKKFTSEIKGFKCFLHDNFEKVSINDLNNEFLTKNKHRLCSKGAELYLLTSEK